VSAIFQRPLCEMGAAYDFAYRPRIGDPGPGFGGPCDTRPHAVGVCSAASDPGQPDAAWRSYRLCEEHEAQLRRIETDHRAELGDGSRLRAEPPAGAPRRQ
jgi:hypothetical protein